MDEVKPGGADSATSTPPAWDSRCNLGYDARHDDRIIKQMIADAPNFHEIAAKLEEIAIVVARIYQLPRPRSKLTILALAKAIAPLINKDVARIYTRRKDGAICWFGNFLPQIVTMKSASVAMLIDVKAIARDKKATQAAVQDEDPPHVLESADEKSLILDELDQIFEYNTFGSENSE
jgi:hypothetical protein